MKLRIAVAVMAAVVVVRATPASAHAGVFVIGASMSTTDTWAPVGLCAPGSVPPGTLCPPATISWSFDQGQTGTGSHNQTPETVSIAAAGTLFGRCGSSTGGGTMTVDGTTNVAFSVTISWVGTTILLSGSAVGHALNAVLTVRPTTGDCVTVPATRFAVSGPLLLT